MRRWIIRHECAHLAACEARHIKVQAMFFGLNGGCVSPANQETDTLSLAIAALAPVVVGQEPSVGDLRAIQNHFAEFSYGAAILWLHTHQHEIRARANTLARALRPYIRNNTLIQYPLESVGATGTIESFVAASARR